MLRNCPTHGYNCPYNFGNNNGRKLALRNNNNIIRNNALKGASDPSNNNNDYQSLINIRNMLIND